MAPNSNLPENQTSQRFRQKKVSVLPEGEEYSGHFGSFPALVLQPTRIHTYQDAKSSPLRTHRKNPSIPQSIAITEETIASYRNMEQLKGMVNEQNAQDWLYHARKNSFQDKHQHE
jgi:hypothetical protein